MSESAVMELLRRVALFAAVPDEDLQAVARATRHIVKKKGARIFDEGSPAESCFVLTHGRAKVVISGRAGTEITLGIVREFELVGEISLLDHSSRSATLVAVEECQLLQISKPSFFALRNNRAFEDRLVTHVTSMLRRATEQLRAIYSYSSSERVAWCLARLASRIGRPSGPHILISPRPQHQEIADMSGCSRETVTRVLLQMKRSGTVSWDESGLAIDERAFRPLLDLESATNPAATARVV